MIRLISGCKINLGLRITGRREDGYHELETIFYPLAWPRDEMRVRPIPHPEIHLPCQNPDLDPENNLITKAWKQFSARSGLNPIGLEIELIKRVPMGAGLGGGSANAGCLLNWLNQQSNHKFDESGLLDLAASLGADVPFFLLNRPCLATGIGEKLTPIPYKGCGKWLVLVCPEIHICTPWAFQAYDAQNSLTKRDCAARNSCFTAPESLNGNDLEDPVFRKHPELCQIKDGLLALGASTASMSGSGSSIYGIFGNEALAREAAKAMRRAQPRVFLEEMRDFGM